MAEQQKIQADFEKQRILILANATAQEVIIKASGEAEAKLIEANATIEAIELVLESTGQSGNGTRIAELYLWVQTLQRIAPDIDVRATNSWLRSNASAYSNELYNPLIFLKHISV